MKLCVVSKDNLSSLKCVQPPFPQLDGSQFDATMICEMKGETDALSYRAQDFVEVHKTDSHRDGLEEDCREYDEPQTLERNRNGHITAGAQLCTQISSEGRVKHFQQ